MAAASGTSKAEGVGMKGHFRGADGVRKLLRIAKAETENLRIDLFDIERARVATQLEIENALAAADVAKSAAVALRERRFNLRKSLNALEAAYDGAQAKLTKAETEIHKLETLAAANWSEANAFQSQRASVAAPEAQAPIDLKALGG